MKSKGLVLGGGGITGIAWEFGVLAGLAEQGVVLRDADTLLGTSAGSVVGTLLLSLTVDEVMERAERLNDPELGGSFSFPGMLRAAPAFARPGSPIQRRAGIMRNAVRTHPVGTLDRVALIRERIEVDEWPEEDLRITATDCETGKLVVFTRHSGVDIVDAVAASCAVPFVWPPVEINGHPYMDGGVRSPTNADLMTGFHTVVVLAPLHVPLARYHNVRTQLNRSGAARKKVISPDEAARKAIGRRVLDPARAEAAAEAGLRQGAELADRIGSIWR